MKLENQTHSSSSANIVLHSYSARTGSTKRLKATQMTKRMKATKMTKRLRAMQRRATTKAESDAADGDDEG